MVSASFLTALGWSPTTDAEIIAYETSDTRVVETSEDDEVSINQNTPDRYIKQKMSAHGKIVYVIYARNDVGVFYNW